MKNGKKLTRVQKQILVNHGVDPDDYLYITTEIKQDNYTGKGNRKSLNKNDVKTNVMVVKNVKTGNTEYYELD